MSTQLQVTDSTEGVKTAFLRDGVAGNYQIVYQMARLIRKGVTYDKGIEAVAKQILEQANLTGRSLATETGSTAALAAIFEYVKANVTYMLDIAGRVESLKSARETLRDGYGDCDDLTVLLATLAGCVGFEDIRIALAKYSTDSADFSHVYCVIYQNNKRYVLDGTLDNSALNKEVKPIEIREINVFGDIAGLDGVSGVVNGARYVGREAVKTAVGLLPKVGDYLPLSFVGGYAFSAGAEMLGRVSAPTYSLNTIGGKINEQLDDIIIKLMQSQIAIDVAKAQSLRIAAEFLVTEPNGATQSDYNTIKDSINKRVVFIRNFEQYAQANNIPVVHLNAHLMMIAGAGITGYFGYKLLKGYFSRGL